MQTNSVKELYQDWASLKLVTGFAAFSENVNLWPKYEKSWRVEASVISVMVFQFQL